MQWPAGFPQNRAYRSGTRLLPCLYYDRLAVTLRIEKLKSGPFKPFTCEGCVHRWACRYPPFP